MAINQISREMLQDLFDSCVRKSKWRMDGPMLWGYFFTHHDEEGLKNAAAKLQADGYRFVSILQDDDDKKMWWLHVEKEEVHSVDSLYDRDQVLYDFAERNGLSSYDGMDVGKIAKAAEKKPTKQ